MPAGSRTIFRTHDRVGGKVTQHYPIPWISTYILAAIALIAGSFFVVWFLAGTGFDYDRYDPDHEYLERIVRSDTPRRGDFSTLNNGAWTVVCLVGPGGDVTKALQRAKIPATQSDAIGEAFDDDPPVLHQTEFVLAYMTRTGTVKLLRHPHGFAFIDANRARCITPERPVVMLPVRE